MSEKNNRRMRNAAANEVRLRQYQKAEQRIAHKIMQNHTSQITQDEPVLAAAARILGGMA